MRVKSTIPTQDFCQADAALIAFVRKHLELRLGNYERIPDDVRDHHETEIEALAGGYSYRQVLELVQNAADAILEYAAATGNMASGRIVLRLDGDRLYAANTGSPLSRDGIVALLSARSSPKRQNQIGRFGIGFKSLLGLGGRIDVFRAFSEKTKLRDSPAGTNWISRFVLEWRPAWMAKPYSEDLRARVVGAGQDGATSRKRRSNLE